MVNNYIDELELITPGRLHTCLKMHLGPNVTRRPESDPACLQNFIRSELPSGLAPQARGRPADGGSRVP